jgi:hypothetical protein
VPLEQTRHLDHGLGRPRARKGAFERLEPCAGKLASTVLRGRGIGDDAPLPDNSLHWTLDLAFREDECRVRTDHAPQNLATLRHLALNLLRQEKKAKVGVKARRMKAAWDLTYLNQVLTL